MELSPRSSLSKFGPDIIGCFTAMCGLLIFVVSFFRIEGNLWHQVAVFALLSFISLLLPARLPQGTDFSLAFILDLVVIALFGAPIAIVTRFLVSLVAAFVAKFWGRNDSFYKICKMTGEAVITVGLAGTVYQLIGYPVLAFVATFIIYFLANTLFVTYDGFIANREPFFSSWISVMRSLYIYFFVLSPLAYLLTYLIENATLQRKIFSVLLFFVPVMLVSHAFRLFINIKQSYLNTVKTMVMAIEAKDSYTKGHSQHVAELMLAMARELGMPEREIQKLEYVALLHDTGKIGVPEEILNKPGTLTVEEYTEVQKHSVLGAEIVRKIKFLSSKADIVLYHHERFDGSGYPVGLKGRDIPLEARILAMADAYDAMVTERPYRSAKTPEEAVHEIELLAGIQFDPYLVKAFKVVLKRRGEL